MTILLLTQRCLHGSRFRPAVFPAVSSFCSISGNASNGNIWRGSLVLCGCHHSRAGTGSRKQLLLSLPSSSSSSSSSQRRFKSTAAAVYDDNHDGSHDGDHDDTTNTSIIPFALADIGEGIKEVELLQWFVQKGDKVQQFDNICEVQSDKATVEITSRYDGIVESLAGENVGDMIQVGDPLMFIRVEGGPATTATSAVPAAKISPMAEHTTSSRQSTQPTAHCEDASDNKMHISRDSQFHLDSDDGAEEGFGKTKFLATPAVRKLGMEYNLDLSTMVGSGPKGRVLKTDVLTFLRQNGRLSSELPEEQLEDDSQAPCPEKLGASSRAVVAQEDEVVKLKGYNRLMIQTMTAALEIPHMGYTDEFNLTKLASYRHEMSAKVSILTFFIKATSLALKTYPMINASWKDVDKGDVTVWAAHNIGVAMDTPRGLVVPVVRNCQDKSLTEIQDDLNELKVIAAAGKLTGEHLRGATFSLSNIGSLGGGTYMNPLIVPPQAGIGAMGAMQTLPRFDDQGDVIVAKIMPMSWAGDHRMIDGATMARFSNLCKQYLEDPVQMLFSMK